MSRIGMFTYSTQPRGSVVHAACLAEALQRDGHEVTLFALGKNGASFFRPIACEVRLVSASEAPARMDALIAQRIGELVAGLTALDPRLDVLHAQDCLVASALLEARRNPALALATAPLIRTVHHVERFESPYLAACQRRSIRDADVLLSVSRMTAEDVWQTFRRRSEVVPNGVDMARFQPSVACAEAELRAALGLPPEAFVVLSVGGIEARKNSLRCLEAMGAACTQRPDMWWVIAGGASVLDHEAYRQRFEIALADLPADVQRRIIRTGVIGEQSLTQLYAVSDALLCASEHEGFGLCVLEAMAARVPVIVPQRPPFTEYVPEHAAAFVDPTSASDITAALVRLQASPALGARLAQAGTAVAATFSWQRSAQRHRDVYERALSRSERVRPQASAPAPCRHSGD